MTDPSAPHPVSTKAFGDAHQIAERRADLRPWKFGASLCLALAQYGIEFACHTGESRGWGG
ncbi:hypothetical protein X759_31240 [Mesorhizobium sp. LSHC420B00]|nr:hypothetical protein X759_31240 [Mesorhizobium sp. LSHC420B00]